MNDPHRHPSFEKLTVGAHLDPQDGACLMETVSILAGQPWSDAPPTTHPLLAHLGRLVNDAVSTAERPRLLPFAPRLVHLNSTDPGTDARLAELTTAYALSVHPTFPTAWMHAVARRQLRLTTTPLPVGRLRRTLTQLRRRAYRRGPAYRAIEAAITSLCRIPDADRHLVGLLERAISHLEAARASSATATDTRALPLAQSAEPLGRSGVGK